MLLQILIASAFCVTFFVPPTRIQPKIGGDALEKIFKSEKIASSLVTLMLDKLDSKSFLGQIVLHKECILYSEYISDTEHG